MPIACPRCAGRGAYRTTVKATLHTEADKHPTVDCQLCRGTGLAPAWGQPLKGTPHDPTTRRREDPT